MRRIYCDICGCEMWPPADGEPTCAAKSAAGVQDVCPRCAEIGAGIDVPAMLMAHWKSLVQGAETTGGVRSGPKRPSDGHTVPEPPKPKPPVQRKAAGTQGAPGSHWAEKRRIMAELKAYRDENGLGSLPDVSEASGVSDDVIRSVLNAYPQKIEVWRKIDAGLAKLRAGRPKAGDGVAEDGGPSDGPRQE